MKARFTQAEITRALRAAKAAGMEVTAIEITPDGSIRLTSTIKTPTPPDAFDDWKAKREKRRAGLP